MEAILLGIYSFFVWLIFIKFKWLPWNTKSQVTVVIIPIVALTVLVLSLNVFAPSSSDTKVLKYTVQILPQVRGRVATVPIEGNKHYKKGEVLFTIDSAVYEQQVKALEAQLVDAQGSAKKLEAELVAANEQIKVPAEMLELAKLRIKQNKALVASGAGDRFALEQAEADAKQLMAQVGAAKANAEQVKSKLNATVNGELAEVAQIRAQLAQAQWDLDQCIVYAPADGYVVNLQLRPGSTVVPFPVQAAMSFVEDTYQVIAMYQQNELYMAAPGNEAEISLYTVPGHVIKAKVDSIVWAQGEGQLTQSGVVPQTGAVATPPQRFAVKLTIDEKDKEIFLAAGAKGSAAIYTDHGHMIHIIRKVVMRVGAYMNYLVLKLH
jgi:multidrug resistance efflux pump